MLASLEPVEAEKEAGGCSWSVAKQLAREGGGSESCSVVRKMDFRGKDSVCPVLS